MAKVILFGGRLAAVMAVVMTVVSQAPVASAQDFSFPPPTPTPSPAPTITILPATSDGELIISSDSDVSLSVKTTGATTSLKLSAGFVTHFNVNCTAVTFFGVCESAVNLTVPAGAKFASQSPFWKVVGLTATRQRLVFLPLVTRQP